MQSVDLMADAERLKTQCCIAGGGPAGLMLGYLLARAGVEVLVFEKHGDFLRDFRGDTIHPSTLEIMRQLGLVDGLLRLPHQKLYEASAVFGDETVKVADFRRLPTESKFIAFMPQWDFLNFLAEEAARHPNFTLRMSTEVTGFTVNSGKVTGVRAQSADGPIDVAADLVVSAEGRHSELRVKSVKCWIIFLDAAPLRWF